MELMITLAVAAIVLALAAPSFREFRQNNRMTGAANDLLLSIQQTRSEAIKRQQVVALCAATNPDATPPSCAAEFGGWVVWVDTDADSTIDAGETVLSQHAAFESPLALQADGALISFAPSGFARAVAGRTRMVVLCDERGDDAVGTDYRKRTISVTQTGRASIVKSVATVNQLGTELAFDASCPQGGAP